MTDPAEQWTDTFDPVDEYTARTTTVGLVVDDEPVNVEEATL